MSLGTLVLIAAGLAVVNGLLAMAPEEPEPPEPTGYIANDTVPVRCDGSSGHFYPLD